MSEAPLYDSNVSTFRINPAIAGHLCEDRVLDGPASGEKGPRGRN